MSAVPFTRLERLERSDLGAAGHHLVIHLHWTSPVLETARTEAEARRRAATFLGALDRIRATGATVAWTIHNVLPHETTFIGVEAELCQGIADRADLVHVMCEATMDAVEGLYALPRERVVTIPHPAYVGAYPNTLDQSSARAALGLPSRGLVLAFLGQIRPYKGLEDLIVAFEAADLASAHLVVAGRAGGGVSLDRLRQRCDEHPRILARFEQIGNDEVQTFMNAADAIVVPYRTVLNSGSVMLAFSFGRPVIAPRVGCLTELLTPDVSLTFEAGNVSSLSAALARVGSIVNDSARRAALRKAAAVPFERISDRFAGEILAAVESRGRRPTS